MSSIVLDDELFEPEERSFVFDSLSDLYLRDPGVRSEALLAVFALHVGDDELDLERLLEQCAVEHLLLHSELDLDAFGVRLGPDEAGVDQLDSLESLDLLETEREQFGRLELRVRPGRALIPVAVPAVLERERLRQPLRDVDARLQTVDARVRLVRRHLHSAHTTTTTANYHIREYILWARNIVGSRSDL